MDKNEDSEGEKVRTEELTGDEQMWSSFWPADARSK